MINAPTFGERIRPAAYRWQGDDFVGATRPSARPGSLPLVPPARTTYRGAVPVVVAPRPAPVAPSAGAHHSGEGRSRTGADRAGGNRPAELGESAGLPDPDPVADPVPFPEPSLSESDIATRTRPVLPPRPTPPPLPREAPVSPPRATPAPPPPPTTRPVPPVHTDQPTPMLPTTTGARAEELFATSRYVEPTAFVFRDVTSGKIVMLTHVPTGR